MKRALLSTTITTIALTAFASHAHAALPSFDATSLTGKRVTEEALLGHRSVLIVTPSRDAAGDTREWAQALRQRLEPGNVAVRDMLAIDLPFFMSERDALGRAREKIPDRYHDQTWLMSEPVLEKAFDIPRESADAYVLVLDSRGNVMARAHGRPDKARVNRIVAMARAGSGR